MAIMLWSRTRDIAWILMVAGAIAGYVEVAYSILDTLGIIGISNFRIGSIPVASIVFSCLPMVFFITAFAVMVHRKYRR